ncbi:arrestin domain-containing protein 3-like [Eucyclogobius newberryi]|uniref:arrestin domain-containing protein 3-like n=1 Tax=Eucyclogobius newberryi TaxID=166745 RepID=UPI003B59E978
MPSVRNFVITYDALNAHGTFSEGDTIAGKVTLELEKETKIESLSVKAKGDVRVHWSEKHGDHSRNYSAQTRLFKQKHFLIVQEDNGTKIPAGVHIFNFSLRIPLGSMPSSFRGNYGKVVYNLEAKLCRSWRMDRTDEKHICFWSKSFSNIDLLKFPQTGSTNKDVGVFSKGTVQMDATVDRRGYAPGDTVSITANVSNSSSKNVTPKFSLIQDVVYRASGNTKWEKRVIHKDVQECVKPQNRTELRGSFKIPSDTPLSIQNCDILSVEYRIKASLDISFSFDPEIVFPVVIVCVSTHAAGGAIGGPSTSDFPPQLPSPSPYSPAPYSGASLYPTTSQYPTTMYAGGAGVCPVSPGRAAGGYHNPVPAQPNAYGTPFSSSSSAAVLHPPPPAATSMRPPSPSPAHPPFSSGPPCYSTLDPPPCYPSAPLHSVTTVPSAPMMTENFLSHSAEEPPSYEILFPSSSSNGGAK